MLVEILGYNFRREKDKESESSRAYFYNQGKKCKKGRAYVYKKLEKAVRITDMSCIAGYRPISFTVYVYDWKNIPLMTDLLF